MNASDGKDTHDPTPTGEAPAEPGRTARQRLGPVILWSRLRRPVAGRLAALAVALACGAVFGFAAALRPDPSGYGTHTQLGFGRCGFLMQTGYPCPTCGMTTSFADFAHGHLLRSAWDQPAGFVLALATAVVGVIALAAVFSGRVVQVNWYRVNPVRVVWTFVVIFFASWGFKMIISWVGRGSPAR